MTIILTWYATSRWTELSFLLYIPAIYSYPTYHTNKFQSHCLEQTSIHALVINRRDQSINEALCLAESTKPKGHPNHCCPSGARPWAGAGQPDTLQMHHPGLRMDPRPDYCQYRRRRPRQRQLLHLHP